MPSKLRIQKEVLEIKLKPETIKKYKREIKKLNQLCNSNPSSFFSNKMKISKDVKKEFQNNFSKKHYDSESAGWFEGWPVMNLIEQSMEIGYRLGKNTKKFKKERENLIKLMKKFESLQFRPLRGYRTFDIFKIQTVVWDKDSTFYMDHFNNSYSIKNPKITKMKFEKALKQWESRFLKTKMI